MTGLTHIDQYQQHYLYRFRDEAINEMDNLFLNKKVTHNDQSLTIEDLLFGKPGYYEEVSEILSNIFCPYLANHIVQILKDCPIPLSHKDFPKWELNPDAIEELNQKELEEITVTKDNIFQQVRELSLKREPARFLVNSKLELFTLLDFRLFLREYNSAFWFNLSAMEFDFENPLEYPNLQIGEFFDGYELLMLAN